MMDSLILFIVILLVVGFSAGILIGIFWLFYVGFWYGIIGLIVLTTLFLWTKMYV